MSISKVFRRADFALLVVFVPILSFAQTNDEWQKVDGSADGSWNDPGHWKLGLPGADHFAYFPGGLGSYLVTFPDGEVEARTSFRANVTSGEVVTFSGANTVFRQPTCTADTYHNEPFGFRAGGSHFFNFQSYNIGGAAKHAVSCLSNFVVRLAMPGGNVNLDFDRGFLNLHDPEGATWAAYTMLFGAGVSAHGNPLARTTSVRFHEGSSLRANQLYIQGNSATNVVSFDGGTHTLASTVYMPQSGQSFTDRRTDTILEVRDAADVTIAGSFVVGASSGTYGNTAERRFLFDVANGGRLAFNGSLQFQYGGVSDVKATGGSVLDLDCSAYQSSGSTTNRYTIVDSTLTLGTKGRLIFGNNGDGDAAVSAASFASLWATNATINMNGGKFIPCTGCGTVVDSTVNVSGGAISPRWKGRFVFTNTVFNVSGMALGDYRAEESEVSFSGCDFNVQSTTGIGLDGSNLVFDDCLMDDRAGAGIIVGGTAVRYPKVVFAGDRTTNVVYGSFTCGNCSGNSAVCELRGGHHRFGASLFVGQYGTGVLHVAGAEVLVSVRPDKVSSGWNSYTYLGRQAGSRGTLRISSGSFTTTDTYGIQAGYGSVGELDVSGGTVDAKRIRLGSLSYSATEADRFTLSGGTVNVSQSQSDYGVVVAEKEGTVGELALDGGVLNCSLTHGGAGRATMTANGGKIAATVASTSFLYGFASATLGEKGLEIHSDVDITVAQDFSGTGKLVLTGSGTKTFTGSGTSIGGVEVRGGKAVFPADVTNLGTVTVTDGGVIAFSGESASVAASLVLGDATTFGVLEIVSGRTLAFGGDLEIANGRLALNGAFPSGEAGTDYAVASCAGTMSEASREGWARAYALSGLAAGDATECAVIPGEDALMLKMRVRKAANFEIRLDAGESNATENVTFAQGDTLSAVVGPGAALEMSGTYGIGRLVKEGGGRLGLTGGGNRFYRGIELCGGTLSVADPAALGLWQDGATESLKLTNGTFEVTGPATGAELRRAIALESAPTNMVYAGATYKGRDGIVVKNDVDLAMPVPQPANAAFFKRGAGRMTLTSAATSAFPAEHGHDVFGYTPAWGEYVFDDEGNAPEDRIYAALNVVEGDLTLKGLGETPAEFDYYGTLMVGVPTKSCTVNPSLTLDHAQYLNKGNGTRLYLGALMANSISSVTGATLTLTNGSTMTIDTFSTHYNSADAGRMVTVDVDGSDLIATYAVEVGKSGQAKNDRFTFRNGSRFLVGKSNGSPSLSLSCGTALDFDASVFARDVDLSPAKITFVNKSDTSTFSFRNGSEFRCNEMSQSSGTIMAEQNFLFNDSKWIPGADDFTFAFDAVPEATIILEGTGLVLEPPAEKTWTIAMPVKGDGNLVVGGAGTVVLDGARWQATGVARVRAGATLDLGGTTADGLMVGGAGTVRNGTASGIALTVDDDCRALETPVLDGVAFAGICRVDLGRTEANPLAEPFRPIAVCTYGGTAPNVSSWRLKGTGLRSVRGVFEAKDGVVTVTPELTGLMLIVR